MREEILLVDDDREVLHIHRQFLTEKGYRVLTAGNVSEALSIVRQHRVSCIVLDVMMPDMDGFTAFPLIRGLTDTPVLFMTGRTDDSDRIRGLTLGADDYIVKPCSMEELSLRIAINIRKSQITAGNRNVLEFPPLRIELDSHSAWCGKEKIQLTNREYELLLLFARRPDELVSFEQIGMALNGAYLEADRKTIMVSTSRLRKKLGQYPGLGDRIETVWGKGYRLRS